MLVKTEGIVLKTTKYKESSLIVKIYTESHGLLSFIVNGVRSSKKGNKGVLFQPLNYLDLIVYYKENKNLLYLKEYKFNFLYQGIPFNIVKSSIAIFMLEVIEHTLKQEEENEELYLYIKNSFLQLDSAQLNIADFHLHFIIGMMDYIGIQAQGKYCPETPFFNIQEGQFTNSKHQTYSLVNEEKSKLFSKIIHREEIKQNKFQRKEMLELILLYYQTHIEDFRKIKSLEVLETVLS